MTSIAVSTVECITTPRATSRRPRDAGRTRRVILRAAMASFATRGYVETGLRDVARAAGINVALVGRYFGSKEGLFEAALAEVLDLAVLFDGPRSQFGAHVVRVFFETQNVPSPLTMMILSASDPTARAISVRLLQSRVIAPLAEWLGGPQAEARAAQLNILWSGFLTAWKILPLAPLEGEAMAATRHWLETATQAVVDGAG